MAQSSSQTDPVTYGDYRTWHDEQRYELVEGLAQAMAPAPSVAHQTLAGEIYRQIANGLLGTLCRPFIAPVDVLFPRADESNDRVQTVLQPDVFVVCDPSRIESDCIRGAPDWVVEVLSPSTASRDHITKRRLYEDAGVREYWLVHPGDRILMIYRLENGVYGKPEVQDLSGETAVGILPGLVIQWEA